MFISVYTLWILILTAYTHLTTLSLDLQVAIFVSSIHTFANGLDTDQNEGTLILI